MIKEQSNSAQKENINRQIVELYASFNKSKKMEVDEDGFIYIEGYASTDDIDRHGDIIPANVWGRKALRNFRKNPIVLYNHDRSAVIGKVVKIEKRENGLFVKCAIDALDNIGRKIGQGLIKTFSIGFYLLDFDYNPEVEAWVIKALELLEISVVSIPANQDATFSLAKQLGGEKEVKQLRQKLLGKTFNQNSNQNKNQHMEDNRSWFQKTFGLGTTTEEATKSLEEVAKEKSDLEQQVKDLTIKFNGLDVTVKTLEAKVKSLETKNATLEATNKTLGSQVETLTTEKEALETALEKASGDLEKSDKEKNETIQSLEEQNKSLKTTATEQEEAIKGLELEVESLKSTIAKAKGIKTTTKGGNDPVLGKRKKSFTSPNADAANSNLEFLKSR